MISDERSPSNKTAKTLISASNNHPSVEDDVLSNLSLHKKLGSKRKADDGSAPEIAKRACLDTTTISVLDGPPSDCCVNCAMYYSVYP